MCVSEFDETPHKIGFLAVCSPVQDGTETFKAFQSKRIN